MFFESFTCPWHREQPHQLLADPPLPSFTQGTSRFLETATVLGVRATFHCWLSLPGVCSVAFLQIGLPPSLILLACRISVPWPGTEPRPWQWKHQILTTRLPGNSLTSLHKWMNLYISRHQWIFICSLYSCGCAHKFMFSSRSFSNRTL